MMERMPQFLQQALEKQYGAEAAEQIAAGMAQERRTSLRVNTLKSNAEAVAQALTNAGIAYEKAPFSADAFLLEAGKEKEIWALPMYENGEICLHSPYILRIQKPHRFKTRSKLVQNLFESRSNPFKSRIKYLCSKRSQLFISTLDGLFQQEP